MRSISSCTACRSVKKKCILTENGSTCQRCREKSLDCDVPKSSPTTRPHIAARVDNPPTASPATAAVPRQSVTPANSGVVASTLADPTICEDLIDIYFRVVHTAQHLLFHPASFIQAYRSGTLRPFLLLGVCAVAARFSAHSSFAHIEPVARGDEFLRDGIKSYYEREKLICVEALQGSILLSFAAFVQGDADQDAMLNCQAVRIAAMLRLPRSEISDPLEREVEINLFWQTWMMELWTCVRAQTSLQLTIYCDVPKPMKEDLFDAMSSNTEVGPARGSSIWGMLIPLMKWYAEAQKLIHDVAHEPTFDFRLNNLVRDLSDKMGRWTTNIPSTLKNTRESRLRHRERGYGRRFAVLYIIYHHTHQLLFYTFLNKHVSSRNVDEEAATFAELCKAHATAVSNIMWELHVSPDMNCLWSPLNGHILVVASTVHLHTVLLQADKPEAAEAKILLQQNFIILQELQKYWSTTKLSISRLHAFHNACRMSSLSDTFNMDHWMARFLNRHDVSVEDREFDVEGGEMDGSDSESELWGILNGQSVG